MKIKKQNITSLESATRSKKIAYVHGDPGLSMIAGQEMDVFTEAKGLMSKGFYPIFVLQKLGIFSDFLKENGIAVEIMELSRLSLKNPLPYLISIIKLVIFLRKENIALLRASGVYPNQYGCIAARLAGIPCVCSVHATVYSKKEIRRSLLKISDKVICVSNDIRDLICASGIAQQNIITVYNGIDAEKFNLSLASPEKIRKEFNIEESTFLVGQISQIIERKGIKYFLEMAKILIQSFSNIKFLIVGEDQHKNGEYREKMQEYANSLGISEKVIFAGFRRDILDLTASIDICVLASFSEGLANTLIEAMALEKPVVATNIPGTREVVVDGVTGFLVPSMDAQALAEKVALLLRDKDRAKKMGIAGKERVIREFSLASKIDALSKVYAALLNKKSGF